MEEPIRTPSQINSFNLDASLFDLNKKRKLQADQFGLPLSKHKSWKHRVSAKSLEQNNQLIEDDLRLRLTKDNKAEEPTIEYGTEPAESGKGSNSFMEYYDSSSSDAKFKTRSSSTATSTLADWSCNDVNKDNNQCSSIVTTVGASAESIPVHEVEGYDPSSYFDEVHQNIEDCIAEVDGEYIFRHEIGSIELFKTLYSNKAKPDIPILSSGSCSVNQDGESIRKPTIDQEFEEYFSMLML